MIEFYKHFRYSIFVALTIFFGATSAFGQVTVSGGTGGEALCQGGGYATLTNIVFTEGAITDFAMPTGAQRHIYLDVSNANFEFNPGVGSVSFTGGGSGSVLTTITVTATRIAIIILEGNNTNAGNINVLTISGIQVRAVGVATGETITRVDATPLTNLTMTGFAVGANVTTCDLTSTAPPTPSIVGSASVCEAQTGVGYSTTNNVGNTYNWSVSGGSITGGAGTNSITVTWGSSGTGTVSLTETIIATTCATTATPLNVTINPKPGPVVSGDNGVCANEQNVVYSTPLIGGHTYSWNVTGGVIDGASTNNSVTIDWGSAGAGSVQVTETITATTCSEIYSYPVTINANPAPSITSSLTTVCAGEANETYSVVAAAGNTYNWTVTGGTITAGAGTNSITVTWGAAGAGDVSIVQTVTATGCSGTTNQAIVINANPTPVISGDNTVCAAETGLIYSTPNVGGNTYSWNITGGTITAGGATNSITVDWGAAGAGTLTVTETQGTCIVTTGNYNVTINANPAPAITSSLTTVCAGEANETYSVPAVAGNTYSWTVTGGTITAGAGTNSITVTWGAAGAGDVSIVQTVTATGCSGTTNQAIVINANPTPVISGDNTVCAAETGLIYSTPNVGGNTYSWNITGGTITAGGATNSITVDWGAAGAGTLTVTETQGTCIVTTGNYNVTINANPAPAITSSLTTVCAGEANETYSVPAVAGNTYSWTVTGGTITAGAGTNSITVTWGAAGAGDVSIVQTVTATGCSGTTNQAIVINANPTPVISGDNTVCAAETGLIYSTPNVGGNTYSWNITGGTITAGGATNSITVDWGAAGAGTLTVTETQGTCIVTTGNYNVTINANPAPSITSSLTTVCAGEANETYSVVAAAGNTYNWTVTGGTITAGAGTNSITVTWGAAGAGDVSIVQTVTATGCSGTTNQAIVINANPTPVISGDNTVCAAETGLIYSTPNVGGNTYSWNITGGTITAGGATNSITVDWGAAGAGTLTVTETQGTCIVTTGNYNVTINANPAPSITSSLTTVCAGEANETYSVVAAAGNTYNWTVTGGTITAGAGTNSITVTWGAAGAGDVSIVQTVTATGCSGTTNQAIVINANPTPVISGDNTVCAGETGLIYSTPNVGGNTYSWNITGGTITAGGATNSITVDWGAAGAGTLTVTETQGTCIVTTGNYNVTINANPAPSITSSLTTVCAGEANETYSVPAVAGNTYSWTVTGGTITAGAGTNSITVTWGAAGAGDVSIVQTVTATGCSGTTNQAIVINANPTPVISGDNTVCAAETGLIYSTPNVGGNTYSWNITGGTITAGGATNSITVDWGAAGAGTLTVTETQGTCIVTTGNYNVTINANPAPSITSSLTTVCAGEANETYSVVAAAGNTYNWTVTGGTITAGAGTNSITVTWGAAGAGDVSIVQTVTATGCSGTTNQAIVINANPTPVISGDNTVCAAETGLIYSTPNVGGNTYSWNITGGTITAGGATNSITVDWGAAGAGTLTVTETQGTCIVTTGNYNVTINANPAPAITSSLTTVCAGEANETYSVPAVAGNTYSWTVTGGTITAGAGTNSITVTWGAAGAGDVSIVQTVTATGCSGTTNQAIVINANPTPVISGDNTVCAAETGLIYSTPNVGGNTYSWNITGGTITAGGATNSITVDWGAAGAGTLTVTETQGTCIVTTGNYNVTINANPAPAITSSLTTVCAGEANETYSVPAVAGNTYSWTVTGGTITAGAGTNSITVTWGAAGAGDVSIVQTVTATGCSGTTNQAIVINANPTPVISGDNTVCAAETGLIYSTPNVGGNTYSWNITGGTITAGGATNSITVDWGAAGAGTLTVTETQGTCIVTTGNYNVTINANPAPSITSSLTTVCAGEANETYSVVAAAGNTYNWTVTGGTITAGAGTNSITVTWGAAGAGDVSIVQTVTATGCSGTTNQAIVINANPTPVISGDNTVCAAETGLIYSTPNVGGNTYSWNITGGTITAGGATNSITVDWGAAGAGTLTVTETQGTCIVTTGNYNVTINANPAPSITSSLTTVCAGEANETYSVVAAAGNTYNWTVTGGTITAGAGTNSITVTWGAAGAGDVSIVQTVTATGCSGTTNQAIVINANPTPVISGDNTVCAAETGLIYSTPNVGGNTYSWNITGGTITAGGATNSITVDWGAAGAGTLTVTETQGTCIVTTGNYNVTINANPAPSITSSLTTVCAGEANETYSVPAVAGNTYSWTVTGGTITAGAGTNSITVTWGAAGAGDVSIVQTVTATGCSGTTNQAIVINANPTPVISGDNTVCAGETGLIYSTPNVGGNTYSWNITGGTITAGGATNSITVDWGAAGAGTLTVTETQGTCIVTTGNYNVTINANPAPSITSSLTTVCAGEANETYSVVAAAGNTYNWTVTGGTITAGAGTNSITVTWGAAGAGDVSIVQTVTATGCSGTTNQAIVINANPTPVISGDNTVCAAETGLIYSTPNVGGNTYSWNITGGTITAGGATNSITVDWGAAGAGTLTVTETQGTCIVTTGNYNVTINANPTPAITSSLTTVCAGEANETYSVPAVAGNTYNWTVTGGTITAGAGTNSITVTWGAAGAGDVSIVQTVTATGCSGTTNQAIIINANPTPVISGDNTVCAAETGLIYSTPNVGGNTYSWNITGGTITAGGATNSITVDWGAAGAGTLTVTETQGTCIVTTGNYNVTINANPAPAITSSLTTVCAGEANETYSVVAAAGNTYNWTVTGGTITAGAGTNSITVTWGAAGVGDVSIVQTVTATGCSGTTNQAIIINANPTPVISGDNTVCAAETGLIYSTPNVGGNTYSWNITGGTITAGGATNSITVDWGAAGAGTLTVTETQGTCIVTTGNYNVTINANPAPAITGSASVCENESGVIYSTPNVVGNSYSWSVTGGSITSGAGTNSITVTWGTSGVGVVSVIETVTSTGCSTTTGNYNVTIKPEPTFTITNTTPAVCEGVANPANITLNSPTVNAVITLLGVNYNGVVGSTNYAGGETFTDGQQITESYSNPGNAPLTVVYTFSVAANGCSNPTTQQTTVIVNPDPVFTITNTTPVICEGLATNITLTSTTANAVITLISVNYRGLTGGTYTGSETFTTGQKIIETLVNPADTGDTVTYVLSVAANGCSNPITQQTEVIINPAPPVFTITNTTPAVCEGVANPANITLNSPTVNAVITLLGVNYNGVVGSTSYAGGETFTDGQQITESYSNIGNAPLTVIYTFSVAANGCSNPTTQQTTVTVNPDPVFTITNTTPVICEGLATNITLTSTTANAVITLISVNYRGLTGGTYTGSETFTTGQKIIETLVNPADTGDTVTYVLSVAANGCSNPITQQTEVIINPAPPVFTITNTTPAVCEGVANPANITLNSPTVNAVITLLGVNYNGVVGSTNYAGGETFTDGQQITESYSNPGNAPLTVVYTFSVAANGCSNPTTQQTTVIVNPDPVFTITNTTPVICEGLATNITLTSTTANAVITLISVNYRGLTGGTYTGSETFTTGQKIIETLVNPADTGDTVTYVLSVAANGCSNPITQQTEVIINPAPPVFTITNTTPAVCEGVANPANITLNSPTVNAVITLLGVNYNGVVGSTSYAGGETFTDGQQITESYSNPGNAPLTVVYTFSVAANGCSNPTTQQTTVIVNPDPVFTITNTTPVICEGLATNITLTSTTANAVITLISVNYRGLTGGTYTGSETFTTGQKIIETLVNPADTGDTVTYVLSVAANGCSNPITQQTEVIINPAPPVFTITNTTPAVCEGVANPANITLNSPTVNAVITLLGVNYNGVVGSTNYAGGETFTDGQQITESYSNPGNAPLTVIYTFSVAANGCSNPTTQQTTVIVNPDPVFTITNTTPVICEGLATNITLTSTTANAVITLISVNYRGLTGGTYTGSETFTTGQKIIETLVNPADTGDTVTYVLSVAANGCSNPITQQTEVIINPAPPVFTITNTTPAVCEGVANPANITLNSPTVNAVITLLGVNYNGVVGSTNYAGGETFTDGQQITESYSNPGNAPLTVVYTFSVAANGCSNPTTQQTTVIVNPDPVFTITNTTPVICEGLATNITLTSTTANAVITLISVNYRGLTGGTYTGSETFTTGQKIIETLVNPADTGDTVTYVLSVAANGCSNPITQQTEVIINPAPPVFTITNTTPAVCEGVANPANITLNSPTVNAVITLLGVNYNGIVGSTSYAGGETFTDGQQITESYSNPGTAPLTVVYTFSVAANGCNNPTTQQTTVTVNPDPVFTITNNTPIICEGLAADITLGSVTANAVITLVSVNYRGLTGGTYAGGAIFSNGQRIVETLGNPAEVADTVTYVFSVASNGCSNLTTQQTEVIINPAPPVFTITNTAPAVCEGVTNPANITLNSPTVNAVITLLGVNYNGVVGSTNYAGGETFTDSQQITESYSNPGNSPLTVIYTFSVAANGCSNPITQQTSVVVNGVVTVSVPSTLVYVCEPEEITLLGSVGGSATSGAWSLVSGAGTISVSSVTEITPNVLYNVSAVYDTASADVTDTLIFRLTTNDPDGPGSCPVESIDLSVIVNESAKIFAGNDFAICEYDTVRLNAVPSGATTTTAWDLLPTGTFESISDPLSDYYLSTAQKNAPGVVLTFTIRTNDPDGVGPTGPCASVFDQVTVTVNDTTFAAISGLQPFYGENSAAQTITGFPSGGFFTGTGVNTATSQFEPDNANLVPDANVVVYHYTNPITGCISRPDTIIRVNPLTLINFQVGTDARDFPEVCGNVDNVLLSGSPPWDHPTAQSAFFSSPDIGARVIFDGFDYFLNTNGLAAGQYIIRYTFTNTGPVTTVIEKLLTVFAAPKAVIDVANSCIVDEITFTESSFVPSGTIDNYIWEFGNGIGSSLQEPAYTYPTGAIGTYLIQLRVITDKLCFHDTTKSIRVGPVPTMKFDWTKFCSGESTQFEDLTIATPSTIVNYTWDFGEIGTDTINGPGGNGVTPGKNGGLTTGTNKDPSHQYSSFQIFPVTLTVVTDDGCQNSLTRQVFIQDSPAATATSGYFENFDTGGGTWVSTVADELIATDTSWVWGLPYGKGYQSGKGYQPLAGTSAWSTGLNDSSYFANEKTALIGPCLDITALDRPMVSVDYWTDLDNRQDGIVLQYSIDGGLIWQTVGDNLGAGINWYSDAGINGFINSPVIQPSGYGWTGESMGWKTARYSLDAIPVADRDQVIFRFLLGTNSDNTPGANFSGVAIDNVYFGEKKRNVMVEYFSNSGVSSGTAYLDNLNPDQFTFPDESDFFRIQYHMGNPDGTDPIYQANTAEPDARSLGYGISRPPAIIMDGILGTYYDKVFLGDLIVNEEDLDRRALENPVFDITITELPTVTNDSIAASVDFIFVDTTKAFASQVILNIGLIESDVSGERNIVRKFLAGTNGVLENQASDTLVANVDSYNLTRRVGIDVPLGLAPLRLIAWVQDRQTKRIHQAKIINASAKVGQQVVGVEDPVLAGAQEIQIFPNPASRHLNFSSELRLMPGYTYSIVDQRGITVMKGELKEDILIP